MTSADHASEIRAQPLLTVGVVVDRWRGPAWVADVITAIAETGDVVVADVVSSSRIDTLRAAGGGRAMLAVYDWIDGHVFGRADDPTKIVELGPIVEGLVRSEPPSTASAANPELVIRLDGATSPFDRWPAPVFGVWTLEHGVGLPPAARLELAPGGPEMLLGRPFTISQLVATVGVERRVIGQVVSSVDRLSLRRGARGHVRKLPGLVARTASAVHADGAMPDSIIEFADAASDGKALSSGAIALGLVRVLGGYICRLIRRKFAPERWVVAISRDRRDPRDPGSRDDRPFQFLEAPDGREWADPFPVRTPDGDLLFLEEYVRANRRGRLAVVRLDDSLRGWSSVETILDLPTHLSYPFAFEWSGSWYLLPEQAATGGLQLYVADAFPGIWRWHSTVLDRPAADATIAEIDGRWWMFAAISAAGSKAADELHLFYAEAPLGPWRAHARNPVLSDVRTARPAGRVYERDGVWYRVAQDGSISYGHSIAIIRIDRIDLDGYRETVVDVIRPDWAGGLMATHTINSHDGLTALDALREEPRIFLRHSSS